MNTYGMRESRGEREHEPRRFLIATAGSRCPKNPAWDRAGLEQARQDVIELFTTQLGCRHETALGLDPTGTQLTGHLRAFCTSPRRRKTHTSPYVSPPSSKPAVPAVASASQVRKASTSASGRPISRVTASP